MTPHPNVSTSVTGPVIVKQKQATLSLLHHYTNQEKWVEKWEGKRL